MDSNWTFSILVTLWLSHTKPTKPLKMHNVLHVPKITKNILGIFRFTKDNNVVAEFFDNSCVIKDNISKKTLLQGTFKGGLYQLQLDGTQVKLPGLQQEMLPSI
ncbi:hypothetical protein ACOSP7_012321 [Xanthoceras sorbifolium]